MTKTNAFIEDAVKHTHALSEASNKLTELGTAYLNSGKVFFTGIGKCSYLAMKQAATLKSICLPAEYLDAINTLHGDLGAVLLSDNPTIVMLSKSGKSAELKDFVASVRESVPTAKMFLLTMGDEESLPSWYQDADVTIISLNTGDTIEFDGFGIVPSISNALFELALSLALVNMPLERSEVLQRLQSAHPGGSLQVKVSGLLAQLSDQNTLPA